MRWNGLEEKEIKGYKTIQGNNCIISCVRNILEFYTGDSIRECDIYLIGNGLGVEYHRTNTEVLISSKVFRVAMNFLDITNIQFQKKTYIDPNVAICEIKNNINANTPVIVQLLAKELDYANAFGGGEDVIHYFNIIGFTDDMLLVSDSYVPTAPPTSYRGLYSTRKILQSMNSAGNLIVTINMSDKEKKAFRELYTPEFVQEFVKRRICEYLNSKKENKDGYYTGFYAIEEMAKDIAEFDIIFAENFTKK